MGVTTESGLLASCRVCVDGDPSLRTKRLHCEPAEAAVAEWREAERWTERNGAREPWPRSTG